MVVNAAGAIENESDYYPWGSELKISAADSGNHYKFTGKERDGESGLDYFGARYYGNWLGRWMSPDWASTPIPVPYADLDDPQTLDLYGYVRNVPTTKIDSDGHGFWTKLKNWWTDGGWNEDAEAQKERQRRLHKRAEEPRKRLSAMKNFKINGKTPQEFAKTATDQEVINAERAIGEFMIAESGKHLCGYSVTTCGIAVPLGLGSTGRAVATNLREQLAMEEAMSDPAAGKALTNVVMNDKRWPSTAGWVKMEYRINGITIHYVRNTITGAVDDFKFVP